MRPIRTSAVLLLAPALFACAASGATAPGPAMSGNQNQLAVVADESTIETQLAAHLRNKGLKVQELTPGDGTDSVLLLDYDGGNVMPDFRIAIDTQASERTNTGVAARVILVRLLTRVEIGAGQRETALGAINLHHAQVWAGCFYINPNDGELEAQWPINIQAPFTVGPEQVSEAVRRLINSWTLLYPELTSAMQGGATAIDGITSLTGANLFDAARPPTSAEFEFASAGAD